MTPSDPDEVGGREVCGLTGTRFTTPPGYPHRQVYPCSAEGAEEFTEDYGFIFFAIGPDNRIRFANRAWYEFAERNAAPDAREQLTVGVRLAMGGPGESERLRTVIDSVRAGEMPFWEDVVPCHSPNQMRWMLYRIQHLGRDVIFSCFFLRHYGAEPPACPRIRCLLTGADRDRGWIPQSDPVDGNTTLALGPTCSLHIYSLLAEQELV